MREQAPKSQPPITAATYEPVRQQYIRFVLTTAEAYRDTPLRAAIGTPLRGRACWHCEMETSTGAPCRHCGAQEEETTT